jgi:hypothetical protein
VFRIGIRTVFRSVVGIVSNLARCARKGYEGEHCIHSPTQPGEIEESFRFAGVSARYCRESLVFLRHSVYYAGCYLKTSATSLCRVLLFGPSGLLKSRGQTEHLGRVASPDNSSRLQSDTGNGLDVK